ncbi:hypothetical protein BLA29_013344, partial [Euroglyphus maynei]
CNVIVDLQDIPSSSTFLLQNYNEPGRKNCSFYMVQIPWDRTEIMEIFLKIIDFKVGNLDEAIRNRFENSPQKRRRKKYDNQCTQYQLNDYAEVDGGRKFGFITNLKPSKHQWCS